MKYGYKPIQPPGTFDVEQFKDGMEDGRDSASGIKNRPWIWGKGKIKYYISPGDYIMVDEAGNRSVVSKEKLNGAFVRYE